MLLALFRKQNSRETTVFMFGLGYLDKKHGLQERVGKKLLTNSNFVMIWEVRSFNSQ